MDPFEIRLKNANRIGDTSPNGVVYTDPSTVPTIHAIADAVGHELPADYRTMTRDPREGELLPDHLARAGRRTRRRTDGQAHRPRDTPRSSTRRA